MANESDYKRGMERLDGSKIGPRRVAYYADEISAWCVVTVADVAWLGEMLGDARRDEHGDVYSEWCAGTVSRGLKPAERRALGV